MSTRVEPYLLQEAARVMRDQGQTTAGELMDRAAVEIEALRAIAEAKTPTREERIVAYRAAALGGLVGDPGPWNIASRPQNAELAPWIAGQAEGYAQAMLAAEHADGK